MWSILLLLKNISGIYGPKLHEILANNNSWNYLSVIRDILKVNFLVVKLFLNSSTFDFYGCYTAHNKSWCVKRFCKPKSFIIPLASYTIICIESIS